MEIDNQSNGQKQIKDDTSVFSSDISILSDSSGYFSE